ncbi:hypothetical protein [Providencia heimbachae]|uniref:Uncharacterized protein n=1 Tax=Providencia heimbachae ATCC 35613 TaxID=1354272 RepID=A0A1B7K170_9GAMM|nr:hypothetical protein [Providencia heimbachae]OAT53900.1 hypothetical protein M998_0745 [Providencia heimbachae ATCC 35613]SQH13804.1 Uncharacterised protein [Providencia heimbachae]
MQLEERVREKYFLFLSCLRQCDGFDGFDGFDVVKLKSITEIT